MPRNLDQTETGNRSDRQAVQRMLGRALENTTRPRARNRKVIEHLRALLDQYAKDAVDLAREATS